jgi:RNA polymerase sigma-70 factor (ECF subfamily)
MPTDAAEPVRELSSTCQEVRAAQGGDGGALDRLFARYLPRVRAMVAARTGRLQRECAEIEDLVQETFRDAIVGLRQIDHASEGMFVAWLARCVENNVRDQARRGLAQKRGGGKVKPFAALQTSLSESLFAGREDPASQVARGKEAEERIERALLALGPRYREVIALRVHGELSYREIAAAMGLPSENTANVLFLRARARLQQVLEHGA